MVLSDASYTATTYPGGDPVTAPLRYSAGNVQLVLIPRDDINWWDWSTALWGMRITMREHRMFFGWDFKVISQEIGEIGYGTLSEIRRDLARTSKTRGQKVRHFGKER